MQRLTEQFEAKADASRSQSILRITAGFDNCSEILDNIRHTLDNIHMNEIDFVLNESSVSHTTMHAVNPMNRSLLSQLEQLTSTVIRTSSPHDLSGVKVIALSPQYSYADFY